MKERDSLPPSNRATERAERAEPTKSWSIKAKFKVELTNFGALLTESPKKYADEGYRSR